MGRPKKETTELIVVTNDNVPSDNTDIAYGLKKTDEGYLLVRIKYNIEKNTAEIANVANQGKQKSVAQGHFRVCVANDVFE